MASISQISGSLAAAQNQTTLALANFNIDFSLIKVSAAEEYQVLGTALSQRRRENAEEGPLHRTARKLGALFEQVIPDISGLSEAYGKRVSEIVEHSNANHKVLPLTCNSEYLLIPSRPTEIMVHSPVISGSTEPQSTPQPLLDPRSSLYIF
jgi:hypothetical protein